MIPSRRRERMCHINQCAAPLGLPCRMADACRMAHAYAVTFACICALTCRRATPDSNKAAIIEALPTVCGKYPAQQQLGCKQTTTHRVQHQFPVCAQQVNFRHLTVALLGQRACQSPATPRAWQRTAPYRLSVCACCCLAHCNATSYPRTAPASTCQGGISCRRNADVSMV